uniref:Uncharacterized protein n=1 Tax=Ditylenchus dipsaci TaxID=166011 RepID=A0A915DNU1_9BILA
MFNLLGNLQKNIAGLYEPKSPADPSEKIDTNKVVDTDECKDNLESQPDFKQNANEAETESGKSGNNFFAEAALNTSLIADKMFGYARVAHEKANKLSSIISEHTIIGDLEKENEHFKETLLNEKLVEACDYPWAGMPDENVARKHIFSLSLDERTFWLNLQLMTI